MSDRELLARLCAGPASGAVLAQQLGVSRAAVWKRIESLRDAGVEIGALPGKGYALSQPLELLDARCIRDALPAHLRSDLAGLEVHFEIDSSNALALREPAPLRGSRVFLCERQTAGRGRRGRAWQSPLAAHLYLTVSRRFETGIAGLQGLSLAVGIATAEALGDLGYAGIGLKWPNDLQVAGRKLGGILIEIGGDVSGPVRTAIGIGVNVAMPAAIARSLDQPWIDLATVAGGSPPSRNHLAAAVLARLLPALARFEREGLRPFLSAWSLLDVLAGREISVFEGQGMRSGRALGIEADGALRFECAGELIRLHGGEVSVRDANPAMMVSS